MLNRIAVSAFILGMLAAAGNAQPVQQVHPTPDCQFFFTLSDASALPQGSGFDNRQQGCTTWSMSYVSSGFTGLTVTLESAANNAGAAGSFSAGFPVQETTISGTNAATSTTGGFWWVQGTNAWVRVSLSGLSGTGVVNGAVFGWRIPNAGSTGGGGGGGITCLTGDVAAGSGSGCTSATVQGIETVPFCSGYTPTNGQFVQYTTGGTPSPCYSAAAATPGGSAGGDLSGSYPNPNVANLSHVTNSSLANSGLAHPSTTVNSQTCTLGSTCTIPVPTIASTTGTLKGDGSGNAVAVTGTASNCVLADGSTTPCTGGGSIATTTNALVGDGGGNAVAAAGTATDCLQVNGGSTPCGGGGGGNHGTALLNISGGVITSSVLTGCITSATYSSAGVYTLGLTSCPANFLVFTNAQLLGSPFEVTTQVNLYSATAISVEAVHAGAGLQDPDIYFVLIP